MPDHPTASKFNTDECSFRPVLDVDIVAAGMAEAGTWSLLTVLGAHPDMVAADIEIDAHAASNRINPLDVAIWNYWALQLRASKPGSSLLAIKFPEAHGRPEETWRIAQIPNLKVLVMLLEPTARLASAYSFFIEDCLRQGTLTPGVSRSGPGNTCCTGGLSLTWRCKRMSVDAAP